MEDEASRSYPYPYPYLYPAQPYPYPYPYPYPTSTPDPTGGKLLAPGEHEPTYSVPTCSSNPTLTLTNLTR